MVHAVGTVCFVYDTNNNLLVEKISLGGNFEFTDCLSVLEFKDQLFFKLLSFLFVCLLY